MSCHAVGYTSTNILDIYDFLSSGEVKIWEKVVIKKLIFLSLLP
jgi:hypothetical protein